MAGSIPSNGKEKSSLRQMMIGAKSRYQKRGKLLVDTITSTTDLDEAIEIAKGNPEFEYSYDSRIGFELI